MDVAICSKDDMQKIKTLYMQAFEDNEAFVDYYFKNKFNDNQVVGIKEQDKLLSMLHLNPFKVIFNNVIYKISYIVAVATDINYRKKGLMGKLMEFSLNKLYLDGEIFSLLMPIDSRIYERYGFGFIEDHLRLDCNSKTFMIKETNYQARAAGFEDIPLLVRYYELFSKQFNLSTIRDEISFNRLLKEILTDNGQIILFNDGYLMTYYEDNILNIREMVYNSEKVLNKILTYLKDKTNSSRVIIHDHFKSKVKYILPNISDNNIILKPFMMARIINVEKFIRKNISLFSNNILIKVIDNIIKENNKTFHIKDKQVYKFDADIYKDNISAIELDIKQLTQLVFGYIELSEIENLNAISLLNKTLNKNHFFNEYV